MVPTDTPTAIIINATIIEPITIDRAAQMDLLLFIEALKLILNSNKTTIFKLTDSRINLLLMMQ